MKITRINGQPYSEELEKNVHDRERSQLIEMMKRSSNDPYEIGRTSDKMEILFDKEGHGWMGLPFQSNVTSLKNATDYINQPRWNWVLNLVKGKLQRIEVKTLDEVISELETLKAEKISMRTRIIQRQGPDYERRTPERILGEYENKQEPKTLAELKTCFVRGPREIYVIDPKSELRVEKRIAKDGSMLYTASLAMDMYIGLSGVPGIDEHREQTINTAIKKV